MTWAVAATAIDTGIPPWVLLGDSDPDHDYWLGLMLDVIEWRNDEREAQRG